MPVTQYVWNPLTDAYLMETDGAGNPTAVYTQEPKPYGGLISQRRSGQTSYYHQDALGSTVQLTDADEHVTDEYVYSAYGEAVAQSGSTVNPFRWIGGVGYYHDDATGDYYVRARNYAPAMGRWTSADPLMFIDGNNLYVAYFIPGKADPSGEVEPVTVVCAIIVVIGGLLQCGCRSSPPPVVPPGPKGGGPLPSPVTKPTLPLPEWAKRRETCPNNVWASLLCDGSGGMRKRICKMEKYDDNSGKGVPDCIASCLANKEDYAEALTKCYVATPCEGAPLDSSPGKNDDCTKALDCASFAGLSQCLSECPRNTSRERRMIDDLDRLAKFNLAECNKRGFMDVGAHCS